MSALHMKKILIISLFFLMSFPVFAQRSLNEKNPLVDSLYREDQFYLGFTFNILNNLPEEVTQSGFSGGIHLGFIRDMPVNKRRNLAIGLGLGWSMNTYAEDMYIGEQTTGETIFKSLNTGIDYDTNRFSTYLIEVPLEFRWRSSSPTNSNFWRAYAGLKGGYIYYFKSKLRTPTGQFVQTDLPELNRFRLGATLALGYNKVNFYFYYSLIPFFDGSQDLMGDPIEFNTLKIGLMFYIL